MLVAALQALYAYNTLATERILDTTSALSVEQWLAPQTAGRGSVRDTLVHLMSGQRGWLLAWGGTLPPELSGPGQLMPEPYPDLAAVRSLFNTVDGATRAFVDTLTEAGSSPVRGPRAASSSACCGRCCCTWPTTAPSTAVRSLRC